LPRCLYHLCKGAGIGGGWESFGETITINGGTITAAGGEDGAGIGNGYPKLGGSPINITINGGIIEATGGEDGAGIGGTGEDGTAGYVTIEGGDITARGGKHGAGIGGSDYNSGGTITITGGTITATGGLAAAGIGAGRGDYYEPICESGNIYIGGGTVTATCGSQAAGIGGGYSGAGATVTIAGSPVVIAVGDTSGGAEHIGGGNNRSSSGTLKNIEGDNLSYLRFSTEIANAKVYMDNGEYLTNNQGLTGGFAFLDSTVQYTVSKAGYEAIKGTLELELMNYEIEVDMNEDSTPPVISDVVPLCVRENLPIEVTFDDAYGIGCRRCSCFMYSKTSVVVFCYAIANLA